jgi:hypothetical protein
MRPYGCGCGLVRGRDPLVVGWFVFERWGCRRKGLHRIDCATEREVDDDAMSMGGRTMRVARSI